MERIAFIMKLLPGQETEYKRRHDQLWPELGELLHTAGIHDYSIYLEPQSLQLFACLVGDRSKINALPQHPVMQRWWAFMSDIMETNADHSPVTMPLQEVFYLP